jgi:uncharacterized membrane protein
MNKTWMRHEGEKWVKDKIITPEQLDLIMARYPDKKGMHKTGAVLPVLASILISLSILSFIASNWGMLPPFVRLTLLIGIMIGFYVFGERALSKGKEALGTSLNLLGIVSFGASIILLGQTFHLTAADARLFVFWSLPAVFYIFRDRNKFYYLLLVLLTVGGQLYSYGQFQSFSYALFFIFLLSAGSFVFLYSRQLETGFFTFGLSAQALLLIVSLEANLLWFFVFGFSLFTLGRWVRKTVFKQMFTIAGTSIAYVFTLGLYVALTNEWTSEFELPIPGFFLPVFFVVLALWLMANRKEKGSTNELIIFLPYFYLVHFIDPLLVGVIYLLVMFLYSATILSTGYRNEDRFQINFGITLFLVVCIMGYFNLAWDFMPKSVFFLIGGILLFILNAFLQRKKKQILKNGGPHHD